MTIKYVIMENAKCFCLVWLLTDLSPRVSVTCAFRKTSVCIIALNLQLLACVCLIYDGQSAKVTDTFNTAECKSTFELFTGTPQSSLSYNQHTHHSHKITLYPVFPYILFAFVRGLWPRCDVSV